MNKRLDLRIVRSYPLLSLSFLIDILDSSHLPPIGYCSLKVLAQAALVPYQYPTIPDVARAADAAWLLAVL
jgi:hypothetical protein